MKVHQLVLLLCVAILRITKRINCNSNTYNLRIDKFWLMNHFSHQQIKDGRFVESQVHLYYLCERTTKIVLRMNDKRHTKIESSFTKASASTGNLDLFVNSTLRMEKKVISTSKCCYCQIRNRFYRWI